MVGIWGGEPEAVQRLVVVLPRLPAADDGPRGIGDLH